MRIPFAESLRFPGEGKSAQGESDPKTRPTGVVDGQQVNIPALLVQHGTLAGGGVGLLDCLRAFKIPISANGQPRKPYQKPY